MSRKKEKLAMIDAEIARVQRELGDGIIWDSPMTKAEKYKNNYLVPALDLLKKEEYTYRDLNITRWNDGRLQNVIVADHVSDTKPDEVLAFTVTNTRLADSPVDTFVQILFFTSIGNETRFLIHCGKTAVHTAGAYASSTKTQKDITILAATLKALIEQAHA